MKILNRTRVAFLASAAAAVTAPAFAQSAPADDNRVTGVEEIIVTAQKREQNLQNVPISITAMTANALQANRVQDVRDLSAVVPNLTVRPSGGGSQLPNYTLRGILTGGSAVGTDKGVALYIDGVYIQATAGSVFETADLERIEVLKGPQGTLFGRNATGGAVSFITRNPTGEFGVRQEFTYGNYDQIRSRTRVDLPQFGPLSLSATYLHKERRGDTRNLGAGTRWDYGPATGGKIGVKTSPKYLGDENVEAVSAAAKLDLHPDLDLIYKFDYSQNDFTPEAAGVAYFPTGFLSGLYAAQSAATRTPVTLKRPKAVNNNFTTPGYSKNVGHNLTAKWQINDTVSVKNILARRTTRLYNTFQLDGLGGLLNTPAVPVSATAIVPPAWLPGGNPGQACLAPVPSTSCLQSVGKPFAYLTNNSFNNLKQWSNEFQVNINTDWFTITAGYLYFHMFQQTGGLNDVFNTNILTAFYGQGTSAQGTAFVIPQNPGFQPGNIKVNSNAVYVQPEFHLTDRLDLVLGGRITKDRKKGNEYLPNQPTNPALPRLISPIRYRSSHQNFLVGVNYRPVDGILTYAKYSTGYISGGQLATIPFQPETAKSWEAGIKADLLDRRLRTNLSVFDVKYKAIQYNTSGTISGVPAAFPFSVAIISSADAKAYGAEWENTFIPVDGLTLGANFGYLHFKFDQDTVFGGIGCQGPSCTGGFVLQSGAPGYREFARPKWTGNLSAQYETAPIIAGGHMMFRVDGNFQSKNSLTSDLTPGTGPTSQADPVLVKAATKPFAWIVNGRVALTDFDLGSTKATVAVWGRNILDNDDIIQFVGLGPVGSALYERARTYGVDLAVEF
ncbi:TonB-dependent receptor [Sphingomonas montanisoli]|uniref:TonB-dependent receptor n=1 Tax=Sphingomonas montanisoli TaxID=2606412 RepID=A0A5D9CCM6_9SPHN|nr:TonB-dependent receptor [Sphingomonas montanisoli]TZG29429.1 TonB-dependent receptor [Sphingomonas montanisoli]